ncbi:DUF2244 domain-containing protein [Jiella marina]|uniref:DUF2244 domain-containing protein n=1 Tax=Jiella sp. LLJ827 TaxID=2917712 RepID=UPI002100CEC9|nr:DUF2244 domain-containing protein [Jiella sp. LLJ827]MCQ0988491.1 DUF2244 domain-containing protein [Jiella sp. LLJ827]
MDDNLGPRHPPPPLAVGEDHAGTGESKATERPIFRALLTPYRSLGRTGFTVLMIFFCLVSLVTGLAFWLNGAWPVIGFFGLDVVILWWAFAASYRSGRATEEVCVTRTDLAIRKTSPRGEVREEHHNPFWARFKVNRHEEIGITRMSVDSRERSTEIGSFLNPDDRESFADAFRKALLTAKGR